MSNETLQRKPWIGHEPWWEVREAVQEAELALSKTRTKLDRLYRVAVHPENIADFASSTIEERVEKAAKAMVMKPIRDGWNDPSPIWQWFIKGQKRYWRAKARTALAAIQPN